MPAKAKILNKKHDMEWLFDVHFKGHEDLEYLKNAAKAAIIVGNEDHPDLIELYNRDPHIGDKPFFMMLGEENEHN